MLFLKLRKIIYKILIKLSLKIYLLSNILLKRTRWLSIRLTIIANKILIKESNTDYEVIENKDSLKVNDNFAKNIYLNKAFKEKKYEFKYITPLFPYLICDHYISMELNASSKYFLFSNINIKGSDLINTNKINNIKNFDIIQVQCDLFEFFHDTVLPYLEKNNIKIVLITSQFHFPCLEKSFKTENCLNHPSIILWISQNPIYKNKNIYFAIPYGLDHRNITDYINFSNSNKLIINNKTKYITNLYSNLHINNLHRNHIRNKFKRILCNKNKKLPYKEYLKKVASSQFLISPAGDREDCYRHYEAIGLGTIPISNISKKYKSIFQKNMIFMEDRNIIKTIKSNNLNVKYKLPNKDILLISYWINKINKKLKNNRKIKII
tara:strand:+ start:139 stop:1278 length:1140 start_codon:yes stop_codon:yes gene_type:complete